MSFWTDSEEIQHPVKINLVSEKEVIGNVLNTCIILHNMTVQNQHKHYVSNRCIITI